MTAMKYLIFNNLVRLNRKKIISAVIVLIGIFFLNSFFLTNAVENDNFIFIGGYGRSGTTLMRAIFDAHPNIRCGPETKIIPLILQWHKYLIESNSIMKQIMDAGIEIKALDRAMMKFMKEIIIENGKLADRLCDKDPNIAKYILYLKKIFPKSKFIFMIRDPRAVVYSYSKIFKKSNDTNFLVKIAKSWNQFMENALKECKLAGDNYCMKVYYEQLVTDPSHEIRKVINHVGERWHDSLLNHEKYIGDEIAISKSEWSTNQIKKSIHTESINTWTRHLPKNFIKNFENFAPVYSLLRHSNNYSEF